MSGSAVLLLWSGKFECMVLRMCVHARTLAFQHVVVTARVCLLCLCSGPSVWVSQCMCVHAHVGGVCWGQLSLCDQLIKRCTLGWTSDLPLSFSLPLFLSPFLSLSPPFSGVAQWSWLSAQSNLSSTLLHNLKSDRCRSKGRYTKLTFCTQSVHFQQLFCRFCFIPCLCLI